MKSPHDLAVVSVSGVLTIRVDTHLLGLQREFVLFSCGATSFLTLLEFHVNVVEVTGVDAHYTNKIFIFLSRQFCSILRS